jgi:hypothetical protein
MSYIKLNCENNKCNRSIQSNFATCPYCKTDKPYRCGKCGTRIGGPLHQGVSLFGLAVRCSVCKVTKPAPRPVTVTARPASAGRKYYDPTGVNQKWYEKGYNQGQKDASEGKKWSIDRNYSFSDKNSYQYAGYSKGYSDGYRARKARE